MKYVRISMYRYIRTNSERRRIRDNHKIIHFDQHIRDESEVTTKFIYLKLKTARPPSVALAVALARNAGKYLRNQQNSKLRIEIKSEKRQTNTYICI